MVRERLREPRAIAPFAHTARAWALYGQQVFSRYVEIGRVCLINYGPDQGKLCTIIDVVDSNKALIDGPKDLTGVVRQMIPFKRLSLTDLIAKVRSRARPGQALSSRPICYVTFGGAAWGLGAVLRL